MSFKEVNALRKDGRLNEAYTMARKENVNSYSLWSVTPSMQSIMNEFEHRVNKARLDNPVNSLNW